MEPVKFYKLKSPAHKIPEFPHFEMELLTPVWEEVFAKKIHCHWSPKAKKHFVCWTERVHDIEWAKKIFNIWSIGTVYSILYGDDFASIMGERKEFEAFQEFMKQKYKICLIQPA